MCWSLLLLLALLAGFFAVGGSNGAEAPLAGILFPILLVAFVVCLVAERRKPPA